VPRHFGQLFKRLQCEIHTGSTRLVVMNQCTIIAQAWWFGAPHQNAPNWQHVREITSLEMLEGWEGPRCWSQVVRPFPQFYQHFWKLIKYVWHIDNLGESEKGIFQWASCVPAALNVNSFGTQSFMSAHCKIHTRFTICHESKNDYSTGLVVWRSTPKGTQLTTCGEITSLEMLEGGRAPAVGRRWLRPFPQFYQHFEN